MARTEALENAHQVLRKDYWDGVRGIVEDCKAEVQRGSIKDRDEALEYVEQTIDGSYWVIYTHANFQVLTYSDNHDAYTEEMGAEGVVKDDTVNWAVLAYFALRQDVMETIGDLDELFTDDEAEDDTEE